MDKQQAHQLLDQLAPAQFEAVAQLLETLTEPLSQTLADASVEDEQVTEATAAALDRARASLSRGEGVSHEDLLREFGIRG